MFSHPDYDGHEALLFTKDAASGLRALIAIHDTTLGPAFGGCRMYPYAREQHAMTDVLRLSRGMTYKAAICELPYGGGKSVMIADPRRDKTPALLHAMGRIIEGLGGRYITADDVGTTLADLIIMREVTCHTAGATAAAQQALPATAFGVFEALRAAAEVCLGRSDLEGLRVAVQGLGNVGMPLCGLVTETGSGERNRVGCRHGPAQLSPPSVPARDHPARDLALSPVHPELPRCRGTAGRARTRHLHRTGGALGAEIRSRDRATAAPAAPSAEQPMAS